MSEPTDRDLLNELGVDLEIKKHHSLTPAQERIISDFEEVQTFYEEFKRLPQNQEGRDIFERLYAVRLNQICENEECLSLLKTLDYQDLISTNSLKDGDIIHQDIDDSELLSKLGIDEEFKEITELKNVRSSQERRLAEEFANREICENFSSYKLIFQEVIKDINNGQREILKLKQRPEIKSGKFFILGGQYTYVENVGEIFMQEYGISDARLYLIFDNGTESRMLMRSFQKALSIDESSRVITEKNLGPLFANTKTNQDESTGTIYVLRSKSNNPFIEENRNLIHKIGFTTNTIQKRIANSKLDPTFLMADVETVASYQLYNLKGSKFESLIQKIFSNAKLKIKINDRFGNAVSPEEWFLVPLEVIKDAIQKIIEGTITKYIYDPSLAKMVEKKIDN
tara:strand:+ start:438 stop:1631 length:1194 start_codon:yes stop_codon:yes gene_type:complete